MKKVKVNSRKIRALIALKGEKNSDIVKVLGISNPTFYEKMSGKSSFKIEELWVLARHFGVDINTLVEEEK